MDETRPRPRLWYTRRGDDVKGPFPVGQVRRYVLLGRIRMSDEVSPDGAAWRRVSQVPEVIPEVMKHLDSPEDFDRLEQARLREDERLDPDRRLNSNLPEQTERERRGNDRRRSESVDMIQHRLGKRDLLQRMRDSAPRYRIQLAVTAALVAGVLIGYWLVPPQRLVPDQACDAPPRPGINWAECALSGVRWPGANLAGATLRGANLAGAELGRARLAGADLAYAMLADVELGAADLTRADLVGANLRGARLAGADLRGADLSYADLTGADLTDVRLEEARFDKAVWLDGSSCGPASVGGCRISDKP